MAESRVDSNDCNTGHASCSQRGSDDAFYYSFPTDKFYKPVSPASSECSLAGTDSGGNCSDSSVNEGKRERRNRRRSRATDTDSNSDTELPSPHQVNNIKAKSTPVRASSVPVGWRQMDAIQMEECNQASRPEGKGGERELCGFSGNVSLDVLQSARNVISNDSNRSETHEDQPSASPAHDAAEKADHTGKRPRRPVSESAENNRNSSRYKNEFRRKRTVNVLEDDLHLDLVPDQYKPKPASRPTAKGCYAAVVKASVNAGKVAAVEQPSAASSTPKETKQEGPEREIPGQHGHQLNFGLDHFHAESFSPNEWNQCLYLPAQNSYQRQKLCSSRGGIHNRSISKLPPETQMVIDLRKENLYLKQQLMNCQKFAKDFQNKIRMGWYSPAYANDAAMLAQMAAIKESLETDNTTGQSTNIFRQDIQVGPLQVPQQKEGNTSGNTHADESKHDAIGTSIKPDRDNFLTPTAPKSISSNQLFSLDSFNSHKQNDAPAPNVVTAESQKKLSSSIPTSENPNTNLSGPNIPMSENQYLFAPNHLMPKNTNEGGSTNPSPESQLGFNTATPENQWNNGPRLSAEELAKYWQFYTQLQPFHYTTFNLPDFTGLNHPSWQYTNWGNPSDNMGTAASDKENQQLQAQQMLQQQLQQFYQHHLKQQQLQTGAGAGQPASGNQSETGLLNQLRGYQETNQRNQDQKNKPKMDTPPLQTQGIVQANPLFQLNSKEQQKERLQEGQQVAKKVIEVQEQMSQKQTGEQRTDEFYQAQQAQAMEGATQLKGAPESQEADGSVQGSIATQVAEGEGNAVQSKVVADGGGHTTVYDGFGFKSPAVQEENQNVRRLYEDELRGGSQYTLSYIPSSESSTQEKDGSYKHIPYSNQTFPNHPELAKKFMSCGLFSSPGVDLEYFNKEHPELLNDPSFMLKANLLVCQGHPVHSSISAKGNLTGKSLNDGRDFPSGPDMSIFDKVKSSNPTEQEQTKEQANCNTESKMDDTEVGQQKKNESTSDYEEVTEVESITQEKNVQPEENTDGAMEETNTLIENDTSTHEADMQIQKSDNFAPYTAMSSPEARISTDQADLAVSADIAPHMSVGEEKRSPQKLPNRIKFYNTVAYESHHVAKQPEVARNMPALVSASRLTDHWNTDFRYYYDAPLAEYDYSRSSVSHDALAQNYDMYFGNYLQRNRRREQSRRTASSSRQYRPNNGGYYAKYPRRDGGGARYDMEQRGNNSRWYDHTYADQEYQENNAHETVAPPPPPPPPTNGKQNWQRYTKSYSSVVNSHRCRGLPYGAYNNFNDNQMQYNCNNSNNHSDKEDSEDEDHQSDSTDNLALLDDFQTNNEDTPAFQPPTSNANKTLALNETAQVVYEKEEERKLSDLGCRDEANTGQHQVAEAIRSGPEDVFPDENRKSDGSTKAVKASEMSATTPKKDNEMIDDDGKQVVARRNLQCTLGNAAAQEDGDKVHQKGEGQVPQQKHRSCRADAATSQHQAGDDNLPAQSSDASSHAHHIQQASVEQGIQAAAALPLEGIATGEASESSPETPAESEAIIIQTERKPFVRMRSRYTQTDGGYLRRLAEVTTVRCADQASSQAAAPPGAVGRSQRTSNSSTTAQGQRQLTRSQAAFNRMRELTQELLKLVSKPKPPDEDHKDSS